MQTKFKKIQCLERAVDILETIGGNKCTSIGEIAKLCSLNQATTYNIVKTLEFKGFITVRQGVYALGQRFSFLASCMDISESLPLLSKLILADVNTSTGEAVCITVLKGLGAEIINLMPGKKQVSAQFIHRSWNFPLNLGTGRLLVALNSESDWLLYINRHINSGMQNLAEKKWDTARWEAHLRTIRDDGYVALRLRPPDDEPIGAVAMPLFSAKGELLGAVGASCPENRATDEYLEFIKNSITVAIENNPL